jgi:hypothetical protein
MPPGLLRREEKELSTRLRFIFIRLRSGKITKPQAIAQGKKQIELQYEDLIEITRREIRAQMRRAVEPPPERMRELEQWRDQTIADWNSIINDT